MLEDHRHLVTADLTQLFVAHGGQILPVEEDPPPGHLIEAGNTPDQCGFARPGETHDHEGLSPAHVEGHVPDPDGALGGFPDLGPTEAPLSASSIALSGREPNTFQTC